MPESKRLRQEEVSDDIIELDAADIVRFQFEDSVEPVSPDFVHQSFGQSGQIMWFNNLMPLSITVHVKTSDGMVSRVEIVHGGDQKGPEAAVLKYDIIAKMGTPCDVMMSGCKPAIYPGDLITGKPKRASSAISPSASYSLPGGFCVERYKASDMKGGSFDLWKRVEWLMLWFIESVSQSQHETDTNWEYFILHDSAGHILAVSSVYRFPSFSYLAAENLIGERLRVSQFLTLPQHRGKGYGSMLLKHIAGLVRSANHTDMLTMEDPSLGMTSLRESVYLSLLDKQVVDSKDDISAVDLAKSLKVPVCFAKRIRRLVELYRLMGGEVVDEDTTVQKILSSENVYVEKFVNSIEFYDDEPLSEEDSAALVADTLVAALRKIKAAIRA